MSGAWDEVARDFHERVLVNCWDSLSSRLLELHEPCLTDGLPVCRGCDREERGTADPMWPCRTYTIIAATMLNISSVEVALAGLIHEVKRV